MKNIILQHFNGELRELDKLSVENMKAYAKMVGADYKLITGKPFREHLTDPCQKLYMLDEEFDKYNQVLMLDIDMFAVRNMNYNVFEETGVGLYSTTQQRLHRDIARAWPHLGNINAPYWGGAIYKLDQEMRQRLRKGFDEAEQWMDVFNLPYKYEDEGIMHVLANRAGLQNTHDMILDTRWCMCSFLPSIEIAKFVHIRTKITPSGPKRLKIENYNELVSKGVL